VRFAWKRLRKNKGTHEESLYPTGSGIRSEANHEGMNALSQGSSPLSSVVRALFSIDTQHTWPTMAMLVTLRQAQLPSGLSREDCLNSLLCFFLLQRDALLANESVRAVNWSPTCVTVNGGRKCEQSNHGIDLKRDTGRRSQHPESKRLAGQPAPRGSCEGRPRIRRGLPFPRAEQSQGIHKEANNGKK
jgi:hypothetical protein